MFVRFLLSEKGYIKRCLTETNLQHKSRQTQCLPLELFKSKFRYLRNHTEVIAVATKNQRKWITYSAPLSMSSTLISCLSVCLSIHLFIIYLFLSIVYYLFISLLHYYILSIFSLNSLFYNSILDM